MTFVCIDCGLEPPRPSRKGKVPLRCDDCRRSHRAAANRLRQPHRSEYFRKWARDNRDRVRNSQLLNKFGISLDQFRQIVVEQRDRCPICARRFADQQKTPHLDHSHTTLEVRGVLCQNCNMKLGWYEQFRENVNQYLDDHPHRDLFVTTITTNK